MKPTDSTVSSKTKLNRRRVLLGLVTGTAGTAIAAHRLPVQAAERPLLGQIKGGLQDSFIDLFDYDGDLGKAIDPSEVGTQPPIPYDRALSKLLIQCSNIALEQFQVGSSNARYDGSIQSLKSYTPALNGFQQVAAFTVDETDTDVSGQIRPLRTLINQVRSPKPVYIGFALTSSQRNLIVLRGTQTPREWIANLQTSQVDYSQAGVQQGRIHRGFSRLYGKLSQQILQAAQRFSSAPTYVTGHSLGGALATLAAADLAANATRLKGQIQLYSYASPRVGDSAFARFYLSLVPNSYRVVNLADMVPEVPPSIIKGLEFQHVGQLWSFLAYTGNISPSHSTISYQIAINQQVETDRVPPFPS